MLSSVKRAVKHKLEEVLHSHPYRSRTEKGRKNEELSSNTASSSSSVNVFVTASSHLNLPHFAAPLSGRVGVLPPEHPEEGESDSFSLASEEPPELGIEGLRSFFEGKKFLIVDDNIINLKLISATLKKSQCEIEQAESGPRAIDLAKDHIFDVIIMDYDMPGMNGDEAIKRIREIEGRTKFPVIIGYSANEGPLIKEKFLAAGANGSVKKPLQEEPLLKEIRKLFFNVMAGPQIG